MLPLLGTLAHIEAFEAAAHLEARLPANTVWGLLTQAAAKHPHRLALSFLPEGVGTGEVRQWTYAELLADCNRAAQAWLSLGLQSGCGVGVLLPNRPEVYMATYGAQANNVACALSPLMGASALGELLNAMECQVLVTHARAEEPEHWHKVTQAVTIAGALTHIVVVGLPANCQLPTAPVGIQVLAWSALMAFQPAHQPPIIQPSQTDPAQQLVARFHTGGTTGTPKVAQHSQRNQVYEAWIIAQVLGLTHDDVCLVGLPLFHVHAAIPASLSPFAVGAHVVLAGPDGFRSPALLRGLWDTVEQFGVTVFSAVPSVYGQLLQLPAPGIRSRTMRYALCGSAPLARTTFESFEAHTGVRLIEGYGLTEATCVSALNPPQGISRPGAIGLRLPYQTWKIMVPDTQSPKEASPGERGALWVRGPNVFMGYSAEALTHQILTSDGWLDTGDLAWFDEQGYAYLCGRAKDLIKRNGHSIDPQAVEEVLLRLPGIAAAAVVGRPDERSGELPVAFVVPLPGLNLDLQRVLSACAQLLGDPVAQPVALWSLDRLPLTAVGKVDKLLLRTWAPSGPF
jgi:fatty-acyl-CoA synthase